jgi:glutathionylspermidine synthase
MRPIKITRRPRWQQHIRENAYQADVLSDDKQQYWVEALPQPFAIQFEGVEERAIAQATESLWEMCVEFLDWFFEAGGDGAVDQRLATLQIRPDYWQAIKNSWERSDPVEDLSLYTRFDLAVTEEKQIKLLEINGETPLLGAETVYQWNWFVDYMQTQQQGKLPLPEDARQFNEFWEQIAGQWRRIVEGYDLKRCGISFLVDENLEEDLEMAMQLIQILADEVDADIYTQLVYLRGLKDEQNQEIQRGLGMDDEGYFIDPENQRIPVLWKMYDWADLQNDMANMDGPAVGEDCAGEDCAGEDSLGQRLGQRMAFGDVKVIEPLWKQVLSNKGAMAMMWAQFAKSDYGQYLLPTYFESDVSTEATALLLNMHVKKPLLGFEGVGISIESGYGSLEEKQSFGYGAEGFIIQDYIPLPEAFGYHYVVGSWSVDGTAAGIIIRGDTNKITGRHCLIVPHIVSDEGSIPE